MVDGMDGIYLGDHRVLTRTKHDVRLILDTRDIILTPILLLNGEWEPETSRAFVNILKPGMNFVDVGANMGYFTALAGRRVRPGGKIWAFEADPSAFEFLTDNVNLNWYFDDVVLECKAVYSKTQDLTLYQRQKYRGNTSVSDIPRADLERIGDSQVALSIQATSLDDYFLPLNESIDLIKIDVEGAEPHVLRGMRGLLKQQPNMKIMIEWSPGQIVNAKEDPEEVLQFFAEHGFKTELILDNLKAVTAEELRGVGHGMVLLTR
jgi:FkbM family methyltransferase